VIAEIAETTAAEVDVAVDIAHAASKKWWRMSARWSAPRSCTRSPTTCWR
jgi:acyl-CoA reductase-like NAD-dependent aldehyde dehydrogenase